MENPSGIAALGINWKFLISQGVNFFILLILLSILLYKPIVKILNKRRETIAQSMKQAEETSKYATELQEKNKMEISQAKEEAKKIVEDAKNTAQEETKKIIKEKTAEAEKISQKAQEEIEFDRQKMKKSLEKELAELVLLASRKLTKKTISAAAQKELVDKVIEELKDKKL